MADDEDVLGITEFRASDYVAPEVAEAIKADADVLKAMSDEAQSLTCYDEDMAGPFVSGVYDTYYLMVERLGGNPDGNFKLNEERGRQLIRDVIEQGNKHLEQLADTSQSRLEL